MQIKLYGNGHSCNIPVQEIIDKYWKDETAPFSFEMSTAIGDETIAATAMLGEESPDTYPSIRLDSRNARKNSSATWFMPLLIITVIITKIPLTSKKALTPNASVDRILWMSGSSRI